MENQVRDWINDLLSVPNPAFAGMPPCPYAKKAWLDGNVSVIKFVNYDQLEEDIKEIGQRVMIFVFTYPLLPDAEKLKSVVEWLGTKHPEYIFYDEHPDTIEEVAGIRMNSGMSAIIVQDRKDLLEKRAELRKTEYYNNWDDDMKERIFAK